MRDARNRGGVLGWCAAAMVLGLLASAASAATGPAAPAPPAAPQASAVAEQKNWRQLVTPHFLVVGNAGERDLRKVAEAFEQFRDAMAVLFPQALSRVDLPTTILVFKDHRSYTPFKPRFEGKPVAVGGYFQGGSDLNYITLTTENLDENLRVVYHEFVHLIVNTVHASLPLWANEGLAEYYSTFEVTDGGRKVALGRPVASHVYTLREQFMPLGELTATHHDSRHYNEGDKRSIFYAESWALMHYLLLGERQVYSDKVGALLSRLSAGTAFDVAVRSELGIEPAELDKAVRRYVQQSRFVSQVATFEERLAAMERVPVTAAVLADVHATLGDLLGRLGRPDEARAQLAHALTLDADSPSAHAALGMLHLRADDETTALAHLERVTEQGSASYLAQFYFAQGLERRRAAAATAEEAAGYAARMETALRRAIELRPGFVESYQLLAYLKSLQPETTNEAQSLVGQALQLAPGREDLLMMAAYLHANRQRLVPARAIASRLAAQATSPVIQQQARDMLARVAAYERQKAQFEAAGAAPADPSAFFAPSGVTTGERFIPALRDVAPHERRVHGLLMAIDCQQDGSVVLQVDDGETRHRARAAAFSAIEFITYRTDLEGSIPCGPRQRPQAVYLTVTPSATPADGVLGDAIAVEFLPDGFVPAQPGVPQP